MKYILLFVILFICLNCNIPKEKSLEASNKKYLKQLSFFKNNFVDHFPSKIFDENIPYYYSATVHNKYDCISIELNINSNEGRIRSLIDSISSVASAIYSSTDTCLLIVNRFHNEDRYLNTMRLTEEDKKMISKDCYKGKLPVQNFYLSNFTTNETEYKLPNDFVLYVIDAKKGKFWDDNLLYGGKYMPPEWEHGLSKGIAISEKRNTILYWFVIW